MMKIFYSLVIRQAQWNTTLQKDTDIILKSTILHYPRKVGPYLFKVEYFGEIAHA